MKKLLLIAGILLSVAGNAQKKNTPAFSPPLFRQKILRNIYIQ